MRMNWLNSTLTQSANVLGLTPVIVGFVLARSLGTGRAASSIVLAGALTALLASLSALLAVTYREPTAVLSRRYFGPLGPRLVGGALAVSLGGWFGLHTMALLQALPPLVGEHGFAAERLAWLTPVALSVGAVASLAIVWRGNHNIARINAVQAPLLTGLVVATSLGNVPALLAHPPPSWQPSLPTVAVVLAAGLGDIIDMPAVLHRSTSRGAAVAAASLTYGLVVPVLLLAGALLASDPSALSALDALAAGSVGWRVAVSLLAIGSATLGNAGLVYAGAWSLAAACGGRASRGWRALQAALAVGIALSPAAKDLPRLLDGLGLASGALGLTMLTSFCLGERAGHRHILAAERARIGGAFVAMGIGATFFVRRPEDGGLATFACCAAAVGFAACITLVVRVASPRAARAPRP